MLAAFLPVVALGALAGCSGPADAPGAITADEERQLNEAATMLDANGMTLDARNRNDR